MTESQGPFILSELPSCTPRHPLTHSLTHYPKVSGANRGIGLALVKALSAKLPHATIFAGARDPASADALNTFAKENTRLRVVKLIAHDEGSVKDAVAEVRKVTDRLDIVIANAGE
jgi:norsolorinic acid ketoreductase